MKPKHKTVLHLLLCEESDSAVIVRIGPRRVSCLVDWDRSKDTFRVGPWFHARVYAKACSLSPDGKHVLIYAMDGHWDTPNCGAWFTLLSVPDFKLLAEFPIGDLYGAFAGFIDSQQYWVRKSRENKEILLGQLFSNVRKMTLKLNFQKNISKSSLWRYSSNIVDFQPIKQRKPFVCSYYQFAAPKHFVRKMS